MKLIKNRKTRIILVTLGSVLLTALAAVAMYSGQITITFPLRTCLSAPRLTDYSIDEGDIYKGKSSAVSFSGWDEAWPFRSTIRAAAARGTNFAGHYAVAEWGCGSDCQNHAIVNVKTGKIIAFGLTSHFGASFAKDSTLIILNPRGSSGNQYIGSTVKTAYYDISSGKLEPVCD